MNGIGLAGTGAAAAIVLMFVSRIIRLIIMMILIHILNSMFEGGVHPISHLMIVVMMNAPTQSNKYELHNHQKKQQHGNMFDSTSFHKHRKVH